MKHLLHCSIYLHSLIIGLAGFCAWVAIQTFEAVAIIDDLPPRSGETIRLPVTDAVSLAASNPAQMSGASIHRCLSAAHG